MIQNLESTLRSGAVPQVPQFRPSTVQPSKPAPANSERTSSAVERSSARDVGSAEKDSKTTGNAVPTAVQPVADQQKSSPNGVAGDPLGSARSKVQEEIVKEFAAIMATGTMRASEAAALATRRVMQRYGQMATSQS
ncbi:hypothetical protein L6164_003267 [Bauhinia variegata]|nr:hypothetical protein L6164_003267 [Bauhinia variegata]